MQPVRIYQLLLLQSILQGALLFRLAPGSALQNARILSTSSLFASKNNNPFSFESILPLNGQKNDVFGNFFQNLLGGAPASAKTTSSGSGSLSTKTDVLVVGSGISGSTAAFYLNKKGLDVVLTEARDVVGGNLISKKADGFLWEEGPNSFQPNPAILRLSKDIDLIDELVLADPTLPRFVYWKEKLYALPGGLPDLINFNLLTWPGKIRAGLGALGFVAPRSQNEETIQEFVTRHLGAEVFERIIDPFVSGVYAGNPRKLSMKAALRKVKALEDLGVTPGILDGAIVRINQIAAEKKANAERDADLPKIPGGSLGSFKEGLQSIPLRIQELLGNKKVRVSHKLLSIKQDAATGEWLSTFAVGNKKETSTIRSKAILLTAPAYAAASILDQSSTLLPKSSEALKKINYPAVASVTVAYPNEAFKNKLVGFGHLIPRAMKVRTLGTIWSSSLFPGRAPEGYTMLLNYIGGAQDPTLKDLSSQEIVDQVHGDIKKILLKEDAPLPKVLGVRVWQQAIPQYDLGHLDLLKTIVDESKEYPGLFLGGNYRTGVAFGDCVQYGADVASEISMFVTQQQEEQSNVSNSQMNVKEMVSF